MKQIRNSIDKLSARVFMLILDRSRLDLILKLHGTC